MKITGTTRLFEVSESIISSFFGRVTYLFVLVTDTELDLPSGRTTNVPVTLTSFCRVPSFDGFQVEVDGDFDNFDSVVRARFLKVRDTGMTIGAAKRIGSVNAVIRIIALLFASYSIFALCVWLIFNGLQNKSWTLLIPGITLAALAVPAFALAGMLVSRIDFPALYEALDRFFRLHTEYRLPSPGQNQTPGAVISWILLGLLVVIIGLAFSTDLSFTLSLFSGRELHLEI